jgi:hypothetical protein
VGETQTSRDFKAVMAAGYLIERAERNDGRVTLRATRDGETIFSVKDAPDDETAAAELRAKVEAKL